MLMINYINKIIWKFPLIFTSQIREMQSHNIRLIDNTYDLDTARQLIDVLMEQKIKFVEELTQNADILEKAKLSNRLDELKAEKRSLDIMFEEYDGEHAEMQIGCTVMMAARKLEAA
jgi:hypothetical protein